MKTLVIGGGMAGLTYAIVAGKNGAKVTVAERNSRVGKKISATGNGRCNIGNANLSPACYNKSSLVPRVLKSVPLADYVRFLNSCGIYTYTDGEGRMYPLSDSAANVVDCLRHQAQKFGAMLLVDTVVTSVQPEDGGYCVHLGGRREHFDKVVLACGSRSNADPTGLQNLVPADCLTPMEPSLVPVRVVDMDGTLNGLRARANATLLEGETVLGSQSGEVLFRDYGLSGICIFNLSAIIARRLVARKSGSYVFSLDVVPQLPQWDLEEIVHKRLSAGEGDKLFYGVLHNKLAQHVVRRAGTHANAAVIAHTAKNLTFRFERLLDWSMSQVACGGVAEGSVDPNTLALRNGVVVLGEALNVDGLCGGYNLYFAAASALHTFSPEQRQKAYSLS